MTENVRFAVDKEETRFSKEVSNVKTSRICLGLVFYQDVTLIAVLCWDTYCVPTIGLGAWYLSSPLKILYQLEIENIWYWNERIFNPICMSPEVT